MNNALDADRLSLVTLLKLMRHSFCTYRQLNDISLTSDHLRSDSPLTDMGAHCPEWEARLGHCQSLEQHLREAGVRECCLQGHGV